MRRTLAITAMSGLVAAMLFLLAPPASAQNTSAVGVCNVLSSAQDAGPVSVGQTIRVVVTPSCAFTPGAPLAVSVNGVAIPGKVASASGTTVVTITVVSPTQLSVDDPISVAGRCGTNTITAVGPSAAAGGATVTHNANFTVVCPAAAVQTSRVALTGADVLRWAAAAVALLVIGTLFVVATRRRRTSHA